MALPPYNPHFEPIVGSLIGLVTDNKDPEGIYRVQVQYTVPSGEILANWARVKTLMSGVEFGWACLPEPDDEVLLKFVHGFPDLPVVVGSLHNGKDKVPFDNADGNNDERIFWSRNLHKLTFNDKSGSEFISIYSTDEATTMDMKTPDKLIAWMSTGDITFKCADGAFSVEAGANIEMKASANSSEEAGGNFDKKAGGNFDLKASAMVNIKGPKVSTEA
ncbi:MAG: phage tail protein [Deltaproteobacteria bacterium]|nr:phage tail protein [Deltaproteobacteria bacterium]